MISPATPANLSTSARAIYLQGKEISETFAHRLVAEGRESELCVCVCVLRVCVACVCVRVCPFCFSCVSRRKGTCTASDQGERHPATVVRMG